MNANKGEYMNVQVIREQKKVAVYSQGKLLKVVYYNRRCAIEVYAEVVAVLEAVGIVVNKHLN